MLKNIRKQIDGWLVIDKPLNIGSTDVVSKIKWSLSPKKIGHAGTLDPLASGVLPIALGHATKLIPFVMDGTKVYDFQITWGAETETDDKEGNITQTTDKRPTEEEVRAVLSDFIGVIEQVPPAYSALKVDGKRAYDLARSGQEVHLKPRAIHIKELHLLRFDETCADFRVVCGKGTYVRSLGRDIGRKLGCLGYISQLRRVACGPFHLEQATDIHVFDDKKEAVAVLPIDMALAHMPMLNCPETIATRLKQGQRLRLKDIMPFLSVTVQDGDVVRIVSENRLIGLARIQCGIIHPYRMFGA